VWNVPLSRLGIARFPFRAHNGRKKIQNFPGGYCDTVEGFLGYSERTFSRHIYKFFKLIKWRSGQGLVLRHEEFRHAVAKHTLNQFLIG